MSASYSNLFHNMSLEHALGNYHAVVWGNGLMQDLGTFGGKSSYADGINAAGQVVGYANLPGDMVADAFIWSGGNKTDLGHWIASASNSSMQVVGSSGDFSPTDSHAVIYENGNLYDLNNLIPFGSSWDVLYSAYDINDSGYIVGIGLTSIGDTHAFVLTPLTPEPGVCSLLAASVLAGLGIAGRRRTRRRSSQRGLLHIFAAA
jgi:probable HAF family extracellular repeat protein